jgi:hypothetical protein
MSFVTTPRSAICRSLSPVADRLLPAALASAMTERPGLSCIAARSLRSAFFGEVGGAVRCALIALDRFTPWRTFTQTTSKQDDAMSMTEELQRAEKRLAALIEKRADQEEAAARADAAARMMAERERAREDAERRRQYQVRYADAFAAFGTQVPAPVDDERPGEYRKRLYEHLRHKLPGGHELATIRADDIPSGNVARNFEQMLLEAARVEGERPSVDNLPRDGSMISRVRVDPDSNQRITEWFGRESFIKQMGREARKVHRFCTSQGDVLCNPRSA